MERNTTNENALNRTILALALASTFVGCSSGTRLFSSSDVDSSRRARGECSIADETIVEDWDAAAGRVSVQKPVSGDGARNGAENRANGAFLRAQYASADDLPELPPPPKSFGERVKGFFGLSKNDAESAETFEESNDSEGWASSGGAAAAASAQTTPLVGGSDARAASESNDVGFATSTASASAVSASRSASAAPKYGEVRKPVSSARRWADGVGDGFQRLIGRAPERVASPTIDPIAQYDESRFTPSPETFRRYRSPLEPREETTLVVAETSIPPKKTTSGRRLVYGGEPNAGATPQSAKSPIAAAPKKKLESFLKKTSKNEARRETFAASDSGAPSKRVETAAPRFESVFGLDDASAVLVFLVPEARPNAASETPVERLVVTSPSASDDLTTGTSLEELEELKAAEPGATFAETLAISAAFPAQETFSAPEPTAPEKAEANDFASLLGNRRFDWFDGGSTAPSSAPISESAPQAAVAENALDAASEPFAQSVAEFVPQTVARDALETVAESAPETPSENVEPTVESLLASPSVSEKADFPDDFPRWNVDELADDGLPAPVAVEPPVAETPSAPVSEELPVAATPSAPVLEELPVAETPSVPVSEELPVAETASAPVSEESPVAETASAPVSEELPVAETPSAPVAVETPAPNSVPKSVDERKTASDAKPPTDEEIAWVEQIKTAIRSLLQSRDAKKARGEDVRADDARLRLLYLAVGEYERAIQEIQDDSDPLKIFWEKECRGLETLLQNRLEEIDPAFVAERLRSGLDSLAGLCDLQIRKAVLATAPACFGLYEERETPYSPGETLYAYSELDFVSSAETESGFKIEVECRWRLLDADGNERTPFEVQHCSTISETKLRDVVLNVAVPLPENIEPGAYSLEMEAVDRNAAKPSPATRRLELTVEKTKDDAK